MEERINFIDDTAKEYVCGYSKHKTLYKYYNPLNLENHRVWFTSPTEWTDPYEQLFLNSEYLMKGKKRERYKFLHRIFCLCMTPNPKSEAAWKMYKCSAKLSVDTSLLMSILENLAKEYDVFVGMVKYKNQTDLKRYNVFKLLDLQDTAFGMDEHWIKLLLLKRMDFKYEEELRIFIVSKDEKNEKGINILHDIPINELYKRVELSPLLTELQAKNLSLYLSKMFNYKDEQIIQCGLYKDVERRKIKIYR